MNNHQPLGMMSSCSYHASTQNAYTGLPLEVWRTVFSYLSVRDLCICTQVCKSWWFLIASIDATVWKQHVLRAMYGKYPNWPWTDKGAMYSWQEFYKRNLYANKQWLQVLGSWKLSSCLSYMKKSKKEARVWEIGVDQQLVLGQVLSVVSDLDHIVLHPGVHGEAMQHQYLVCRSSVEVRGLAAGVEVLDSWEHIAPTGRLTNLHLHAPSHMPSRLKVTKGHLQVDNCIIEDRCIIVEVGATAVFRYCTLQKVQLIFNQVSASLIEHCQLIQCQVCVQGAPPTLASQWSTSLLQHSCLTWPVPTEDGILSASSAFELNKSEVDSIGVASIDSSSHKDVDSDDGLHPSSSHHSLKSFDSLDDRSCSCLCHPVPGPSDDLAVSPEQMALHHVHSDLDLEQVDSHVAYHGTHQQPMQGCSQCNCNSAAKRNTDEALQDDPSQYYESTSSTGSTASSISHEDDDYSLWSSDGESVTEAKLQTSFRALVQTNENLIYFIHNLKGPVFRKCLMRLIQHGVTITSQGQCRIEECELVEMPQHAIKCSASGLVAILENSIHHCRGMAIVYQSTAAALIAANDVYCCSDHAIHIQQSTKSLLLCNIIHHNKQTGVVISRKAAGIIRGNNLYQNKQDGIHLQGHCKPLVTNNRICYNRGSGVLASQHCKAIICDNVISHNHISAILVQQWAQPILCSNLLCHSDGPGLLCQASPQVQTNIIKGNHECGVLIADGTPVLLQNQIYGNDTAGIQVQDHQSLELLSDNLDSSSNSSLELDVTRSAELTFTDHDHVRQPQILYNTIFHNQGFGLFINDAVELIGNAIHDNKKTGIHVNGGEAVISENSITNNTSGITIGTTAKAKIKGNGVYDNNGDGIRVEGEAVLTHNDVFGNQRHAVVVRHIVHMTENRLHSPMLAGVKVSADATGEIRWNRLYPGCPQLIKRGKTGRVQFSHNTVMEKASDKTIDKANTYHDSWHLDNPSARPQLSHDIQLTPVPPTSQLLVIPFADPVFFTEPAIDRTGKGVSAQTESLSRLCYVL